MTGLWGGRFSTRMADSMVPLNRSLDVDLRLWDHDIRASRAWARALARAGVISEEEGDQLDRGLEDLRVSCDPRNLVDQADEDVHSLVERMLYDRVGQVAGKLHTGRSRNDQVATDMRLWGMAVSEDLEKALRGYLAGLLSLAETGINLIMPGFTHLQPAQPISMAHWALSHFWPGIRDLERIAQVRRRMSSLPLGSGALAGCPFPIDRKQMAEELGFQSLTENSIDGVSDRDWMAELIFAGSLVGVHLSRLAEDLVLFSSREFGFVRVPEAFCTGSSLMPQKRNPDAAELIRGRSGRLIGNTAGFLSLLKGLPTGYNRDLQEDKALLFETVDSLLTVVPVLSGLVPDLEFDPDALSRALHPDLLATDLADILVRKGVPFRESHEIVGRLVREGEEAGTPVTRLPPSVLEKAHPALDAEAVGELSFPASIEKRDVVGGTAPEAVERQIQAARRALDG